MQKNNWISLDMFVKDTFDFRDKTLLDKGLLKDLVIFPVYKVQRLTAWFAVTIFGDTCHMSILQFSQR